MLILAGITINALTGSDSAPAKANEAEQKNDIGSAKDQINLTAVNAKTEAYETAYVGNGVTSTAASTTVGQAVIDAVKAYDGKTQGKASIEVTQAETNSIKGNATITITTRDFIVEGTITIKDGILTWGEIEENKPRIIGLPSNLELDMGTTYPISVMLKGTTGDISWTSSVSAIAKFENGNIITADSIENSTETATITASAIGCENRTCIVTVRKVVAPQVGDYINYNIQYTDIYQTDKTFNTANGWRILNIKRNNFDNTKYDIDIISTGIPARLNYWAGQTGEWWGTEGNINEKAAYGLQNNFESILFSQTDTPEKNEGGYILLKDELNNNISGNNGRIFLKGNKATNVRCMTLGELNEAYNKIKGTSRTAESRDNVETLNLFYMKGLTGYTADAYYWLATADAKGKYKCEILGVKADGTFIGTYNASTPYGIRPVITLESVLLTPNSSGWIYN